MLSKHRLIQAEQAYRKVLEKQPDQSDALYGLGVLARHRGDYSDAEKMFRAVLRGQPESFKAWFSLGNLHQDQGQWLEAVEAYQRALTIQPEEVAIYNNLGYTLQQQGKFDEAIVCYQKALELQPDCAEADGNLGNALFAQGKLSPDKQAYYARLNNELGIDQKKAGNFKDAVACYRQAIAMQPDLENAHYNLGVALQDQGELEEAIACCQKALELNPNYWEVHLCLGKIYQKQNKLTEAALAYRQGLKFINPHYAEAVETEGDVLGASEAYAPPSLQLGEVTKDVIVIPTHRSGIKFLENLLTSFKGYKKYPILIVVNDYEEKDFELFLQVKNKFKELPITIENLETNSFTFGGVYTAYQKTDYEEMLLLGHSCEIVNNDLFDLVFQKHENKSIAFALQDALISIDSSTPRRFKFWQGLIGKYRRKILDQMNLPEYLPLNIYESLVRSEVFFTNKYQELDKDTIVLFPTWVDRPVYENKFGKARMKIANDYLIKWKGHWNVVQVLEEGLARGDSWATSRIPETFKLELIPLALQLAFGYHQANQLNRAERAYCAILEVQPDHAEALYGLGVLVNQLGQLERAEQLLRAVLRVQPNSTKAWAWFSLGNLRQAQGQMSEAVEYYHRVLALQPNSAVVHNNLGYALQQQGLLEEAITCYQKALEIKPDCAQAKVNLSNALVDQGKLSAEKQVPSG